MNEPKCSIGDTTEQRIADLTMMLRRMIWQINKQIGDSSLKALAGNANQLLDRYGLISSPLRDDGGGRDTDIARLTQERDLAIAHDRQPYPTVWAYEQACEALKRAHVDSDRLRAQLAIAHNALVYIVRRGYTGAEYVAREAIKELEKSRVEVLK